MERESIEFKPNATFNHYMCFMESEVGRTGRSVHRILADYLKMKRDHPQLVTLAEGLEIEDPEAMSADQMKNSLGLLEQFQIIREKNLKSISSPQDHPWYGIAQADHQPEELESMARTLRLILLQLHKLWVEIQSVPLFLNTLDRISLREIEKLFSWVLMNPEWTERVSYPKLIPAFAQSRVRPRIFEFVRDIRSYRLLKDQLMSQGGKKVAEVTLEKAQRMKHLVDDVKEFSLQQLRFSDLQHRQVVLEKKREDLKKKVYFFEHLSDVFYFPKVNCLRDAFWVSHLLKDLLPLEKKYLKFRSTKLFFESCTPILLKLKEEVDLLEKTRKQLECHFEVNQPVSSEELRRLAAELTASGALRTFHASYQAAVHRYQNLLKDDLHRHTRRKKKETPHRMSQQLIQWADYLDECKTIEKNSILKESLGSFFQGIETDFVLLLQADAWAQHLKTLLEVKTNPLGSFLWDWIMKTDLEVLEKMEAEWLLPSNSLLQSSRSEFEKMNMESIFSNVLQRLSQEIEGIQACQRAFDFFHFDETVELSQLQGMQELLEECLFLKERIESNTEVSQWLKNHAQGVDTDLELFEQCYTYLHHIETSEIPDLLKSAFLCSYGPQRLSESRNLVNTVWPAFSSLKEAFQKLEREDYAQTQNFYSMTIPCILNRIQKALKASSLFSDWISYLKCEQELKNQGLKEVLDYCLQKNLLGFQLTEIYEFAWITSLLKKVVHAGLIPDLHFKS